MKKSLLVATLLLVGASSAVAMDTEWYVGIGAEKTKTNFVFTDNVGLAEDINLMIHLQNLKQVLF